MTDGERNNIVVDVPPLLPHARGVKLCKEGCPGCKLDEINKIKTGIPYFNFFYIWVVSLCSGKFKPLCFVC
jgi:Iap family predicted aminopeptidase